MAEFDPTKLIKNIEERIVHSDRLGDIKYTPLLATEVMKLNDSVKETDDNEDFALKLGYAMFHKSYPTITFAQFESMGLDAAEITRLILSDADFLGSSSDKQ